MDNSNMTLSLDTCPPNYRLGVIISTLLGNHAGGTAAFRW